ncbi:fumarylacetoacetate hydrolase family protein [Leptolyngbya sp. FACHB-261]|uniref:fumarylacetoacetate hydrolase family protein n=1 Tax=Leptolyngbya sp. FACHB-261 TaxID=2692806 RepID=UPI00168A0DF3|nr:fumarylacetoacetate hydrolase family protein [Leptolyngbya sp. FACHB-261]MBD2103790.1 fumarylacetoacetate hydrolase family protein [Leptolyngbya sp. FACHB-261]
MAPRYVRVKTAEGRAYYGLLQLNRAVQVLDAPPWLGGQAIELELAPDTYQLLAPCSPSKIVAVGKNYAAHAAEMASEVPSEPLLFFKPPSAVLAPEGEILLPPQSQRVDYEGELALVIGSPCFNCTPEVARSKIWGYTIANDVTARDLQRSDKQWARAKGFDTFCPLGPWIVREVSAGARLQTFVGDGSEPVQSDSIEHMVYSPEVLVAYISQVMTLLPGDVILTGTPEGVGPLKAGDQVRVEIESIGSLHNSVGLRQPLP